MPSAYLESWRLVAAGVGVVMERVEEVGHGCDDDAVVDAHRGTERRDARLALQQVTALLRRNIIVSYLDASIDRAELHW